MPMLEWKCRLEHVTEKYVALERNAAKKLRCPQCGLTATRVAISQTGTPILKEGRGGFYRPTKAERAPEE